MSPFKGNAIIGQSGGPTSVINNSLVGVIDSCLAASKINQIYGMRYGIEGFMQELIVDLGGQKKEVLKGLRQTPSSALGSSRHKLKEEDLVKIKNILEKYHIRYFFLIGGNDTMDTIHRVEKYCKEVGYELIGVGIPKTVDNDLFGTDHTPGYASAARSNLINVLQSGLLARDMQKVDKFLIYQTIGRDAGWLAAATATFKKQEDQPPHLIYLPERSFDKETFLIDAEKCIKDYGYVSIVCGEGLKYANGVPVSQSESKDKFNNIEFGAMGGSSVAMQLHQMLYKEYGYRGEFQITESLIMSAMDRALETDKREAYLCGKKAVEFALTESSGYMVGMKRTSEEAYEIEYIKTPLPDVAIKAKPMPANYLNDKGNMVSEDFVSYAKPLLGEEPEFHSLDWNMVKK